MMKKFETLESDLEVAKKDAIELFHLTHLNNLAVFPIPGFCSESIAICKIKKFACKALKGRGSRSGIRVIYAYHPITQKVVFLEMYFKPDQTNEDQDRIKAYLQKQ